MQSIYIDAQCSDLSAHSLYIQRRYIEAIEQIIKSLRKYSLIEKKHIVPANIEMCFINFAASLQDECQNNRVSPEKDLYIALLANLRRYPNLMIPKEMRQCNGLSNYPYNKEIPSGNHYLPKLINRLTTI